MGSFFDELKALVNALEPEQVLYEPWPMKAVDYSPQAVGRRLRLAAALGDVCRSLRRVGRQLRESEAQRS